MFRVVTTDGYINLKLKLIDILAFRGGNDPTKSKDTKDWTENNETSYAFL